MQEVCKNCIHCHQTKELINKEWKIYHICTLWLDLKVDREPMLLTLGDAKSIEFGKCECIELKGN